MQFLYEQLFQTAIHKWNVELSVIFVKKKKVITKDHMLRGDEHSTVRYEVKSKGIDQLRD